MPVDSRQSEVDRVGSPQSTPSTVGNPVGVELARPSPAQAEQPPPLTAFHRVVVERIQPNIDGGRFPMNRTVGETVEVRADIFADGHDVVVAVLRDRHLATFQENPWRETAMNLVAPGNDEWAGRFDVGNIGWHEYSIVAWVDRFRSWRHELQIK